MLSSVLASASRGRRHRGLREEADSNACISLRCRRDTGKERLAWPYGVCPWAHRGKGLLPCELGELPRCMGRSLRADSIRPEQQNRSGEPTPQEESAHRPEGAMRRFKLNRLGDGSGCRGLGDCLGGWRACALPGGRRVTSAEMTYQRPTAVFNIAPAIS